MSEEWDEVVIMPPHKTIPVVICNPEYIHGLENEVGVLRRQLEVAKEAMNNSLNTSTDDEVVTINAIWGILRNALVEIKRISKESGDK